MATQLAPYQTQVSPSVGIGRISPQKSPSPLAGAIMNLADATQQRQQQNGVVEASRLMADARAQWTKHVLDAQNAYQPGQDFAGTIMGQFKDYHDKTLKAVTNPFAKKFLDSQLTNFGSQIAEDAVRFQSGAEVSGRVQTFQEGISSAGIAVRAKPEQFDHVYGEQLSALQALQIDPVTKGKLAASLRETLSLSAAKAMGEKDPYGTMVALANPQSGNPVIDRLSLDGREQAQEHILSVQRMLQAQEDHAMNLQDKLQRDASDSLLKDGIKLAQNSQLTPQWIESHHATWEPQAYQYLYGLVNGKGETTNARVYAPLMEKALQGQDVTDDARDALFAGAIKIDDYNRLLEKSSSPRQNWVKRGAEYIATSAGVSQLNPDPAAAQRKAVMLDEWDQWVDQNPAATPTQARDKYQGIVKEYALIDASNLMLIKPLPRYAVGGRTTMDIEKTEAQTVKAFQSGELSQQEFAKQAKLLKEWREALEAAHGQEPANGK